MANRHFYSLQKQISLSFTAPLFLLLFTTILFSQDAERVRPKIIEFGKSLKKNNGTGNTPPNADSGKTDSDDDTIKVETNLVRTDVLVVDKQGKVIRGLKPEDFTVTENDVPQEIGTFSVGSSLDVPRSIVLIIDYSGSQRPYIANSVNAAKVLVDKLNPRDQMAVVTDDIELLVPFTRDKSLLKNKLDSLAKKAARYEVGKSKQYSALYATLNELFDAEDIRPMVIFQTDGDESFSIRPDDDLRPEMLDVTNFTVSGLFGTIEKSRATIYSIVSGPSYVNTTPEERRKKYIENLKIQYPKKNAQRFLESLPDSKIDEMADRKFKEQNSMIITARASGGFSQSLETPDQADQIYSTIFDSINDRYLIGYYPSNSERDGKRRNVKIEVKGHPDFLVWGRKFYYAPAK